MYKCTDLRGSSVVGAPCGFGRTLLLVTNTSTVFYSAYFTATTVVVVLLVGGRVLFGCCKDPVNSSFQKQYKYEMYVLGREQASTIDTSTDTNY